MSNYEKLTAKLKEISHKIDEKQNWTYEHNVIKNSPLFKPLDISMPIYDILAKLKGGKEIQKTHEVH